MDVVLAERARHDERRRDGEVAETLEVVRAAARHAQRQRTGEQHHVGIVVEAVLRAQQDVADAEGAVVEAHRTDVGHAFDDAACLTVEIERRVQHRNEQVHVPFVGDAVGEVEREHVLLQREVVADERPGHVHPVGRDSLESELQLPAEALAVEVGEVRELVREDEVEAPLAHASRRDRRRPVRASPTSARRRRARDCRST